MRSWLAWGRGWQGGGRRGGVWLGLGAKPPARESRPVEVPQGGLQSIPIGLGIIVGPTRFEQSLEFPTDQLGHHLGVGRRPKPATGFRQSRFQLVGVFDHAVVHQHDTAGAVAMPALTHERRMSS